MQTQKLGILGGGQLAWLTVQEAKKLGFRALAYVKNDGDPVCQDADETHVGELDDLKALSQFVDESDVVLFESELVPLHVISQLSHEAKGKFRPSLETMAVGANKWSQKQLFQKTGLASAPAFTEDQPESLLEKAEERFPEGYVLKWAQGGYDGHGVRVVRPTDKDHTAESLAFIRAATDKGHAVYAEALVPFQSEFAMVATRNQAGDCTTYPLVESIQTQGVCHYVRGPATNRGISPDLEQQAQDACQKLGRELGIIGSFAIEFFLSEQGELLLNEFAPRVHNSGHYSSDASATSQFENHVRACLDLELGSTVSAPHFAMINILGQADFTGAVQEPKFQTEGATCYWYGKAESRPMRKIGHVNLTAADQASLEQKIKLVDEEIATWQKQAHS